MKTLIFTLGILLVLESNELHDHKEAVAYKAQSYAIFSKKEGNANGR